MEAGEAEAAAAAGAFKSPGQVLGFARFDRFQHIRVAATVTRLLPIEMYGVARGDG